ncbi:MAG: hypothetical protein R3C28_11665 [Pirellulaceae bacterium]
MVGRGSRTWWLRLFPIRRREDGSPAEPEDFEISMITKDKTKLAEIRTTFGRQLVDAVHGGKYRSPQQQEDQCTGRFWEGRYKENSK